MKFVLIFVLVLSLISSCLSAMAMGFFRNPKNPGKCTISEKLVLNHGQEIKDPNTDCGQITCTDGEKGLAHFYTCGVMVFSKDCKVFGYKDKSLPYPDCCEKVVKCD